MIEESGVVVAVDGEFAFVETQRKTSCQSCSVNKGCGTHTLSKVMGNRATRVRALNNIGADVDDVVVVALAEDALVKGSLAVYSVPLISMLLFALFAQWSIGSSTTGEGWVVLSALAGLMIGFYWLRGFSAKIAQDKRYQPVIIRRQPADVSIVEFS